MNDNITISRERLRQIFFNSYPGFFTIQELTPDSSGFCSHNIPTTQKMIDLHFRQFAAMLDFNADFSLNVGDKAPDFVMCECGQRFAAPLGELVELMERHVLRDHQPINGK